VVFVRGKVALGKGCLRTVPTVGCGGRVEGGEKLPGPEYVACVVTFSLGGGG
jgi:hypothetical protein